MTEKNTVKDLVRELDGLGSIEIKVRDPEGKTMFHWREGKISLGILKTLTALEDKAGIPPDIILEERERCRKTQRYPRRRRP